MEEVDWQRAQVLGRVTLPLLRPRPLRCCCLCWAWPPMVPSDRSAGRIHVSRPRSGSDHPAPPAFGGPARSVLLCGDLHRGLSIGARPRAVLRDYHRQGLSTEQDQAGEWRWPVALCTGAIFAFALSCRCSPGVAILLPKPGAAISVSPASHPRQTTFHPELPDLSRRGANQRLVGAMAATAVTAITRHGVDRAARVAALWLVLDALGSRRSRPGVIAPVFWWLSRAADRTITRSGSCWSPT